MIFAQIQMPTVAQKSELMVEDSISKTKSLLDFELLSSQIQKISTKSNIAIEWLKLIN